MIDSDARCAICRQPFTDDEWNDRHDAPEDDDEDWSHAHCCETSGPCSSIDCAPPTARPSSF